MTFGKTIAPTLAQVTGGMQIPQAGATMLAMIPVSTPATEIQWAKRVPARRKKIAVRVLVVMIQMLGVPR